MILGIDEQLLLFGEPSEQPVFLFRVYNLTRNKYEFWKVQNNNEVQAYRELAEYLAEREIMIRLVTTTILQP
jgi:hypothetical protein